MKPHPHKALILQWAEGAAVEVCDEASSQWLTASTPAWDVNHKYRVKPAAPVVETKMNDYEINCVMAPPGLRAVDIARRCINSGIARAIADGQVVTREAYERMTEQLHVSMSKTDMRGHDLR